MDQEEVKPKGVCAAFQHLETASVVAKEVQDCEEKIASEISSASDLKARLSRVLRQVSNTRGAEQMEDLVAGLIRELPSLVETARGYINDNKLLDAHAILMQLEDFRDSQLLNMELLKSGDVPPVRKKFESCFEQVKELAGEIARQVRYTCSRALQLVRGHDEGSVELVNALRIIEREERDAFYETIKSRYVPACRPRQWKSQLFSVLGESVQERIDACQFEDRSVNKEAWLCKYLEVCRHIVLEDLTEVLRRLARCFPPDYNIYQRYLEFYHDAVSKRIEQIADDTRLERNELVQLLTWVRAYSFFGFSEEVITDPIAKQRPILTSGTVHRLSGWFVQLALRDIRVYLTKLSAEHKGYWYMGEEVEQDAEGYAYSKLPSLLFGLLDDNVALASKVAPELGPVMVDAALDEYSQFADSLVKATAVFKGFCMRDRAAVKNFTSTTTAIANDFDECLRSTGKLKETIIQAMEDLSADHAIAANDSSDGRLVSDLLPNSYPKCNLYELLRKIDTLKEKWHRGVLTAVSALCDELVTDTAKHLGKLGTMEWLGSSSDLDSFLVTVQDYSTEYGQLRSHIQSELMEEVFCKLVVTYVLNMEPSKLNLVGVGQRVKAAERLRGDAETIDKFFQTRVDASGEEKELPVIEAFGAIADVLESRDKEVLPLSMSMLVKDTGLTSVDILSSLLQSRGDISAKEARELAGDAIRSGSPHSKPGARMVKLIKLCESKFHSQSGKAKQKHRH